MYETTDSNTLVDADYSPAPGRKLNGDFYDVYSIEDEDQNNVYDRLSHLVKQLEDEHAHVLVEGLAPGSYVEGGQMVYTLLVTVSH